jgi:hypothetical protein
LLKTGFFKGIYDVFIRIFNSAFIITGNTRTSAPRVKKQNEASLYGSNFINCCVKKTVGENNRALLCTVKNRKVIRLLLENRKIYQKFQRIKVQQANDILSQKNP